ncbi:MAG TPA: hypothetical protein VFT72_07425 [Opitutaceae bacterium]|nr:hypothetical protein [Opitutaceae bacterium]
MTRAFTLSTLLRRRISAATAVRHDGSSTAAGTLKQSEAPRRFLLRKPPEPAPFFAPRAFDSAPRVRQRFV